MGGHLARMLRQGSSFSGRERNCVFLNTGESRFANVSFVSGVDYPDDGRAAARVDWDFDGDVDLWFSNRNGPQVRFLKNELRTNNHFLSLRLKGTTSNRDGVGARIELFLKGNPARLLRTLHAGDGYLTQSSKWLHLGLGASHEIEKLRVRWPGGNWEEFEGAAADGHFRLVQGSGRAKPWDPPRPLVSIRPQPLVLPTPTQQAQIYSATRFPMPEWTFESDGGTPTRLEFDRPTLVILWASWCQPCLAELAELVTRRSEIDDRELRILALSVDKCSEADGEPTDAIRLLREMGFPYESGFATDETVQKLQMANDYLFGLQRPLPIPTSVLIDTERNLAALYRGPVSLERVAADLKRLDLPVEQRRTASVPFSGRWAGKPTTLLLAPFVMELADAGFLEEASEYVQRVQNTFNKPTILDLVSRLGVKYYRQGMHDHADLHFRMAAKIDSTTVLPQLQLANHLESTGQFAGALKLYQQAIKRSPTNSQVHNRRAWLLATCPDDSIRNGKEAVRIASQIVQSTGRRSPALLDTIAAGLAEQQQFLRAVTIAREATERARESRQFSLANEIELRAKLYEQQRPYLLPVVGK